jgi:hypothetical protein
LLEMMQRRPVRKASRFLDKVPRKLDRSPAFTVSSNSR